LDDVILRLAAFGYTVTEDDSWVLGFIIQKITNHILDYCNVASVPEGLYEIAVDMVTGEFLQGKRASGQLDESSVLTSEAVTSIKLGDTQVSFGSGGSQSEELSSLLSMMTAGHESDLESYRCMRW